MKVLLAIVLIGAGLLVGYALGAALRRRRRRQAALEAPFPEAWVRILEKNLPPYPKLTDSLQEQLHKDIQVFLADKSFEGCGGQEINDEVRVTIAAQACMLLLNRKARVYPKLRSILVYPDTYVAGEKGVFGAQYDESSVRLGESWHSGAVVLSWDDVKRGARNFKDGHNVTMHEFAHQLDQEDGASDGTPVLGRRSAYTEWAKVFSREYKDLQRKTEQGRRDVMDSYGATNEAEFFAVATEAFFEKPKALKKKHPELYEELRTFYQVEPLEWV